MDKTNRTAEERVQHGWDILSRNKKGIPISVDETVYLIKSQTGKVPGILDAVKTAYERKWAVSETDLAMVAKEWAGIGLPSYAAQLYLNIGKPHIAKRVYERAGMYEEAAGLDGLISQLEEPRQFEPRSLSAQYMPKTQYNVWKNGTKQRRAS